QVQQDVQAALARLVDARAWADGYEKEVLPDLARAREEMEKLFAQGDPGVDVLRLIEVQRRYLRALDSLLDARFDVTPPVAPRAPPRPPPAPPPAPPPPPPAPGPHPQAPPQSPPVAHPCAPPPPPVPPSPPGPAGCCSPAWRRAAAGRPRLPRRRPTPPPSRSS